MSRRYTLLLTLRALMLAAIATAVTATAHAEPVYTNLDPDLHLTTRGQTIPIDLDANGVVDFSFYYDVYNNGVFIHLNVPTELQSTNKVVVTGLHNTFGKDEVLGIGPNEVVPGERTFNGSINGNGPVLAQPAFGGLDRLEGQGVRYMGVRFSRNGATHYGWIRIEVDKAGTDLTVYDYAYESAPETPITTGVPGATLVQQINVTGAGGVTEIDTDAGTLQMSAEVLPAQASEKAVRWSVDDTTTATIDANGLLRARANGGVTVIATSTDGTRVQGSTVVVVSGQVVKVARIVVRSLNGDTTIKSPGGSIEMTLDVEPSNATNQSVVWSVDDESIATITEFGILKARKNGRVVVTATALDGSGVTGSAAITITGQPVASVDREMRGTMRPRITATADRVTIELPEPARELRGITLYDMEGRSVATRAGEPGSRTVTVDCSSLPGGVYLIVGEVDDARFSDRVLIAR